MRRAGALTVAPSRAGPGPARSLQPDQVGSQDALRREGLADAVDRDLQLRNLLRDQPVVHPVPVATRVDDAGGAQDPEMPRDVRLRHGEGVLEVAHAQLAMAEE